MLLRKRKKEKKEEEEINFIMLATKSKTNGTKEY